MRPSEQKVRQYLNGVCASAVDLLRVLQAQAADAVLDAGTRAKKTARRASTRVRRTGRRSLPIARYDSLTAADVLDKLRGLSQIDLAKVDAYERRTQNRLTVLGRTGALLGKEPWPGYDELNASEVNSLLGAGDEDRMKRVRAYERSHKNRAGVINTADRQAANALPPLGRQARTSPPPISGVRAQAITQSTGGTDEWYR